MPVLRKDPIVDRWVLFSESRGRRPSDFGGHCAAGGERAVEDPATCPFESHNEAMTPPEVLAYRPDGGAANTPGWTVRVIPNKFPALETEGAADRGDDPLFQTVNGVGAHEVIVETPDHASTLADLSPEQMTHVLRAFQERIRTHTKDPRVAYVSIFKNEGKQAGASRAHTHSQLLAMPVVPKTIQEELVGSHAWYAAHGTCVYCAMLEREHKEQTRMIATNEDFVALAPFAPRIPFETWIVPLFHSARFEEMNEAQAGHLATMLPETLRRLNGVLNNASYNFYIHTAPCQLTKHEAYHWHIEILPFTIFIGGFERASDAYINALWPEAAAKLLADASS